MAEHDPFSDLHELARVGEEYAHPLPAERVRQLGQRRRTRRQVGLLAAAAVAIVVTGGAMWSSKGLWTNSPPEPVATPTALPTPTAQTTPPDPKRVLTEANLITAGQVPTLGQQRWTVTAAAAGRAADQSTVCLPKDGLATLRPASVLSRAFRMDRRFDGTANPPEPPFGSDPTVYTNVLQFDSAAAAAAAYTTYRNWLERCEAIEARGDDRLREPLSWIQAPTGVSGARGGFTEVIWRASSDTSDNGYFESVGLTLLGDRLAVTVSLQYGMDYNTVAYQPEGDPDLGLPPHPQFGLIKASAARLSA
jgi:hypothetical protein